VVLHASGGQQEQAIGPSFEILQFVAAIAFLNVGIRTLEAVFGLELAF